MKKTLRITLLIIWCIFVSYNLVYAGQFKIIGTQNDIDAFHKSLTPWNPFVEPQALPALIDSIFEGIDELIGPTFIRSQIAIKIYSRKQLDKIFIELPKSTVRLSYEDGVRPKSWYSRKDKSIYIDIESHLGILVHELTHAVLHQNFILSHKIAEILAQQMELKLSY